MLLQVKGKQPLCTLSRQVKAHTHTNSCWFGDKLLSLSIKSNVLVQVQLYSLSLCFPHISLPTLPLKLHVNPCHYCSKTITAPSPATSHPPLCLSPWWDAEELISSILNHRYQWKNNSQLRLVPIIQLHMQLSNRACILYKIKLNEKSLGLLVCLSLQ